ncbi:glutathione-s-transferase theta, gst [Ilyonectria robusta]
MSDMKTLILHSHANGPNPWKVALVLEELGLPYQNKWADFAQIKKEPFLSLNPNGRVPALEDPNTGISLWESGAIIDYLVDRYDKDEKLHYASLSEKYMTRCWEHFQMSGQGPYFGQKAWFTVFHAEKIPSAIERYANEIKRVNGVINVHLEKQGTDYLVGDKITYADLMFIPWARMVPTIAPEVDSSGLDKYNAWLDRMCRRPAVVKVLAEKAKKTAEAQEGH